MNYNIGVTQWQLPCSMVDCVETAAKEGMKALQIDLGSSDKNYPLTDRVLQERLLSSSSEKSVSIVSVVLNDLCSHGFTKADDAVAYETLRIGVRTAEDMNVHTICMPSFFDNAIRDEDAFQKTVKALRYICDLDTDIQIYTENILTGGELIRLFEETNRPNLRLLFDSQNYRQMAEKNALDALNVLPVSMIGDFVHIKKLGDRPLGEGNSELPRTLAALLAKGFEGSWILENKFTAQEDVSLCAERLRLLLDESQSLTGGN